jgi:hypothetical protein
MFHRPGDEISLVRHAVCGKILEPAMAANAAAAPFDPIAALATAFATNNRINLYLVQNIPEEAWRATPPGGKGRSIASIAALNESFAALAGDVRIKGFKPDVAGFLGYLFAHEGHHRGQITMLARQTGHPVSQSTMFGLWEWGTR